MAGVESSESKRVSRTGMADCNDESYNIQESENVGNDLLDDLDSYLEDINERLTISRMVSDSIIKGIVNAVSQEAAEEVAVKELEIAELKEELCHHRRDCGEFAASLSGINQDEQMFQNHAKCSYFLNGLFEPDNLGETLRLLTEATKDQLERLGQCIEHQKVPECTNIISDMNSAFYSLKAMVETMCREVGVTVTAYVQDCKLEQEICAEVEAMVFAAIFQSMQDDYERCLVDVNGVLCSIDRFKEISNIRHELFSIQKSLDGSEHRHLSLQGSQEIDNFHHKILSSHELPSGSLWDVNGRYKESKIGIPEDLETSKLKHMNCEELYDYFRNEITKLKRDHESTVQQMTEEYFSLKRQFLKERELLKEKGLFAPSKKDKDFEMLRKNISDVILKLDDILVSNERLSEFCQNSKRRLDVILSENQQFRDLLNNQKLELDSLTLQASHSSEKLSQYSMVEENLRNMVGHLESSLEYMHLQALIREEVYDCILRDVAAQANSGHEDSEMKSSIMQDIIRFIYKEAVHDAEIAVRSEYEDASDSESTLLQEVCVIVFQEMLRNLSMEFTELKKKNLKENDMLASLESKALEIENELQMEVEENKKLRHQVSLLEKSIEMKDKSLLEVTVALEEKQQQLDLVNEELSQLTISRAELRSLICGRDKEVILLKDRIAELQKQVDCYAIDVGKLNEKLELSEKKLRKDEEEKATFILVLEQERNNVAMLKAKHGEYMKHMETVGHVLKGLSKSFSDFERTTTDRIRWHNVRLDNSAFQLHSLIPKINNLRRTKQLYKERLDKKCSDLQKAEVEVDLLGDEVDALSSLLEKIYVALDHYSPILQHYPGIIEILKLVKRGLSGEPVKAM